MVKLVTKGLSHVEVVPFDGLLVEFVQRRKAHAVIRGLRAISDFEYEFQMALVNRKLNKSVETVFLMPSEEYSYLTSTLIKEVASFGGRLSDFLHPQIAQRLLQRLGRRKA
jgi:pantetheine-phosphate adenylyltransferase